MTTVENTIMVCRRCRALMVEERGHDSIEGFYAMWRCLCGEYMDDVILANRARPHISDKYGAKDRVTATFI